LSTNHQKQATRSKSTTSKTKPSITVHSSSSPNLPKRKPRKKSSTTVSSPSKAISSERAAEESMTETRVTRRTKK